MLIIKTQEDLKPYMDSNGKLLFLEDVQIDFSADFGVRAFFSGDAFFSGYADFRGDADFRGNAVFRVRADFRGDAVFRGDAFFSGDAVFVGDADFGGDADFSGDAVFRVRAFFSGDADFRGDADFCGDAVFRGDLFWAFPSMPKAESILVSRVLPPAWQREYWGDRLGVDVSGCYDAIISRLDLHALLLLDKWTRTERWMLETLQAWKGKQLK